MMQPNNDTVLFCRIFLKWKNLGRKWHPQKQKKYFWKFRNKIYQWHVLIRISLILCSIEERTQEESTYIYYLLNVTKTSQIQEPTYKGFYEQLTTQMEKNNISVLF